MFDTTQSVTSATLFFFRRLPEDGTPVPKRVVAISQRELGFVICVLLYLLVRILTTQFRLPGVLLNKVRSFHKGNNYF
jgi:hypothetical protein